MAHPAGGGGQQPPERPADVVALQVEVADPGPDGDRVGVGVVDGGQLAEAADVDDHRRASQPEVHGRDQALAPRQHLGLVAVLAQE